MKTCPVCHLVVQDAYLFCPEDGSSLRDPASANPARVEMIKETTEKSRDCERAEQSTPAPVLYCPACALEYPLTFSQCPVHGASLTRQKVSVSSKPPASVTVATSANNEMTAPGESDEQARNSHALAYIQTYSDDETGSAVSEDDLHPSMATAIEAELDDRNITADSEISGAQDFSSSEFISDAETHYSFGIATDQAQDQVSSKRSLRIAAIATSIALALFAIIALYALYTNASRKPASSRARQAESAARFEQQPLIVPVPQPPPASSNEQTEDAPAEEQAEDVQDVDDDSSGTPDKRPAVALQKHPRQESSLPPSKPSMRQTDPTPAVTTRTTSAPQQPIPRGAPGSVDARLVRVRSMKTVSGYRYDLTFNLQELAGRTTQWERLLINTQPTSGANFVQTVPFFHRLGASGALTFTVSVEMRGRSEADWRGRILCTAIGSDNADRIYRASFGASVAP